MTVGGIFTAIIFGAVIGGVARLIVPGKQNMPIWLTVVVGIVAAFIGTGIAHGAGLTTEGWNLWETLLQVAVAVAGVYPMTALWPKRPGRGTASS